jgi:hypothetical protein
VGADVSAQSIVVKHWDRFQHYKDRDPSWVKLYRDLLTAESWVLGTDVSRLVQVASLLLSARYTNKIPLDWELIRKVASFDFSEKDFRTALVHLASTNFLEIQSVTETGKAVVQDASAVLEQRREDRENTKRREELTTTAASRPTNGHATDDEFDALKALYPRRSGSQPWQRARKAINARLAEGHTWTEILEGAKRYGDWCQVTGKVNTEHVKQAATFCGPDKGFLEPWTLPATKAETRQDANAEAFETARARIFGP